MRSFAYAMSLHQILDVWGDLVAAYHGVNGYGSDTAEIYAYRMLPDCPRRRLSPPGCGGLTDEAHAEAAQAAARNLYGLLATFREHYPDCRIYPDCTRSGNGRILGKWYTQVHLDHRTHVRILRTKPRRGE